MTQRSFPDESSARERARISVLLPVHQAAATLPTCLNSLARQSERRWHCVAVDDGSTDAGASILDEAARRDPRIEVLHTPHRGLVAALEAGLSRCSAPLIARMDADDWMHRDRLSLQIEWLQAHPGHSGVGARVRAFPRGAARGPARRDYETWINTLSSPESVRNDAFVECPIAHPTLTIRTEVLRALGYRNMGWPEDYDLVLRLLAKGHRLAIHPRRLLGWRDHPQRLSRTAEAYSRARFTQCKAAHLSSGLLEHSQQYWLWGYGDTGRALHKALAKFGRKASHIIELHPGRLGQTIHDAAVIHPDELSSLPRRPLVVSVAGAEARAEIRSFLHQFAFEEQRDFVCAA